MHDDRMLAAKETLARPIHDKEVMAAMGDLYSSISKFALDRLREELEYAAKGSYNSDDNNECYCKARYNYGLPCRHILVLRKGVYHVDLSWVHKRWCLNNFTG